MVTKNNLNVFEDMASWDDLYSVTSLKPPNPDHTITHMYVVLLPLRDIRGG